MEPSKKVIVTLIRSPAKYTFLVMSLLMKPPSPTTTQLLLLFSLHTPLRCILSPIPLQASFLYLLLHYLTLLFLLQLHPFPLLLTVSFMIIPPHHPLHPLPHHLHHHLHPQFRDHAYLPVLPTTICKHGLNPIFLNPKPLPPNTLSPVLCLLLHLHQSSLPLIFKPLKIPNGLMP